jgi:tetratricopeptide (TPR) repeat protein
MCGLVEHKLKEQLDLDNAARECERLRSLAEQAFTSGQLEESEQLIEQWLTVARESGDVVLLDRALCIRSAVRLERGSLEEPISTLGKVLLRNTEVENRFLAAYTLARAHDRRKDWKKALFYARLSRESAQGLGRRDWIASSENQIGNLLLTSSYFEEAIQSFECALDYLAPERSIERSVIVDNLGYCYIVQEQFSAGFRCLFESLRNLRALGARRYEIEPRMSLSFAYLEIERPERSLRHGMHALALAEEFEDADSTKTSLFLLGEAAKLLGNDLGAQRYFRRLQEAYYPEDYQLTDMLMVVDARSMVNLKA